MSKYTTMNSFNGEENRHEFEKIVDYIKNGMGGRTPKPYKHADTYLKTSKCYNYTGFLNYLDVKDRSAYSVDKYRWLHMIDKNEAIQIIQEFKDNKATSLKNYIKKYGEVEGTKKFEEFKNRTLGKHRDVSLWIVQYGEDYGKMLFSLYKRVTNKRCIEYWLHNNDISYNDAVKLQTEYQLSNSGVHEQYYIERNLPIKKFNHKKGKTPTEDVVYRRLLTKHECGKCSHPDRVDEWKKYKNKVAVLTKKEPLYLLDDWDLYDNNKKDYQIDHQVSIVYGFNNNIPEEIIASIYNLKIIPSIENNIKSYRCSIDAKKLIRKYNENKNN